MKQAARDKCVETRRVLVWRRCQTAGEHVRRLRDEGKSADARAWALDAALAPSAFEKAIKVDLILLSFLAHLSGDLEHRKQLQFHFIGPILANCCLTIIECLLQPSLSFPIAAVLHRQHPKELISNLQDQVGSAS